MRQSIRKTFSFFLALALIAAQGLTAYAETVPNIEESRSVQILGAATYTTTINYMIQKNDNMETEIGFVNYTHTASETLKTTVAQETTYQTQTASSLFDNKTITNKGYTAIRAIYSLNDEGNFVEKYRDSEIVRSPESEETQEDLYIFYTNDAVWDTTTDNFRASAVTVEAGEHLKNDTLEITIGNRSHSNGDSARCGETVIITLSPNDGYTINWTAKEIPTSVKGEHRPVSPTSGSGNTFTFIMGTKPVTITPKAVAKTAYKITYAGLQKVGVGDVNASFNGGQENPNPTSCFDGMEYTLTPPFATGKKFAGWQVNDDAHTVITDGILRDVTAARTLTALWEEAEYTLSANYIYPDELRSDLPVDSNIVRVIMNRDNGKKSVVLTDGQYTLDKPHVEFGQNDYTITLIGETVSEIENAENGTVPKSPSDPKKKVIDTTVKAQTTVSINAPIKTILKGEKFTHSPLAKVSGEKKVKIMSSNKKVASSSKKGVITGKKRSGLAELYRTVYGSTVSGSNIKVYNEVPVYQKSIILAKNKATKEIGLTGVSGKVEYESDDPTIATVDEQGVVTAVTGQGTTKIIMTIHDKKYKIKVRVGEQKEE